MKMVALRIPDELKKEMARLKINWSDYLRRSISEALESEKKRSLFEEAVRVPFFISAPGKSKKHSAEGGVLCCVFYISGA